MGFTGVQLICTHQNQDRPLIKLVYRGISVDVVGDTHKHSYWGSEFQKHIVKTSVDLGHLLMIFKAICQHRGVYGRANGYLGSFGLSCCVFAFAYQMGYARPLQEAWRSTTNGPQSIQLCAKPFLPLDQLLAQFFGWLCSLPSPCIIDLRDPAMLQRQQPLPTRGCCLIDPVDTSTSVHLGPAQWGDMQLAAWRDLCILVSSSLLPTQIVNKIFGQ